MGKDKDNSLAPVTIHNGVHVRGVRPKLDPLSKEFFPEQKILNKTQELWQKQI